MQRGPRAEMLRHLVDTVTSLSVPHPVRVAVDGRPASGKSTLADELGELLCAGGRSVIRASIDEFMYPKEVRYRRGVDSADGCYHDSFDFDALHESLLRPLGPGGSCSVRGRSYDRETDCVVFPPTKHVTVDEVLLFDGVFLMRPELNDSWELRILVATSFEESLRRARLRDTASLGSVRRVEERFHNRYGPSQTHYSDTVRPIELADVIIDNENPEWPAWVIRWR